MEMGAFNLPSLFFGIYLTIPFVLGCFLLLGIFATSDRNRAQRVTGALFIIDAIYLAVRTYLLSPDLPQHEIFRETFFVLDSTIIAMFGIVPYTILSEKYPKWWMYLIALFPLVLLPISLLTENDTISTWSHMVPLAIGCVILGYVNQQAKQVDNHLPEYFADPDMHAKSWVVYITIGYLCVTILSLLRYLMHGHVLFNMIVTLLWSVLMVAVFIFLIRQKSALLGKTEEEEEEEEERKVLRSLSDEAKQRNMEAIRKALDKCIKKELYLKGDMSLEMLSRECDTNRTYLTAYLREELHVNFYEFINTLRVQKVEELLSTNMSQENIAMMCGYNSSRTMRSAYQKVKGIELKR